MSRDRRGDRTQEVGSIPFSSTIPNPFNIQQLHSLRPITARVILTSRSMAHLLVAHPGHELLLHGWISRTKPVIHVLTDGSPLSSASRLGRTTELLRDLGARSGAIFGADWTADSSFVLVPPLPA